MILKKTSMVKTCILQSWAIYGLRYIRGSITLLFYGYQTRVFCLFFRDENRGSLITSSGDSICTGELRVDREPGSEDP